MKCALSILFMVVCAAEFITAIPVRNGMVFYQSNPGYYDNHRAFVMQYASQPVRSYRRNGVVPASSVNGVSAFVAGKRISTGTIVKQQQSIEEQDELPVVLDGAAHSVATAYPEDDGEEDVESSFEDEKNFAAEEVASPADEEAQGVQPTSVGVTVTKKKLPRKPVKPAVAEEEDDEVADDDEEDEAPPAVTASRNRKNQGSGPIYFPVHFGSTNGGAIAVANSYSTGKGGSATSHATAYGSPSSKAKKSAASKKKEAIKRV